MTCLDRLEGYLREHQVPYQTQYHYRATTAQQVAASEHIPCKLMAKVVMAFADQKLVMLVLPASSNVEITQVATSLGAHTVRLATEREFVLVFPDCELGAMPPFGNLYNLPVYVDRELAEDDRITFQAGTHDKTINMSYVDYARLVAPVVCDLHSPYQERFLVTPFV